MRNIFLVLIIPLGLSASRIDYQYDHNQHLILENFYEFIGQEPNAREEISLIQSLGLINYLTSEAKNDYREKVAFHKRNADRTYQDAKKKCWYLPNVDERERAKQCFAIAGTTLIPSDPKSKFITLLITTMIAYGVDCYDEWNDIETKLHWSKYHYEMAEFYQSVLEKG